MEKSVVYQTRKFLMETLHTPTISDCKRELGKPLAELVFNECHEDLQPDFGLKPPLEGPGELLWTSPSDLLIGIVCLKPPLTEKHMQALTHQGILEIGYHIEQKFRNEMETEKAKAIKEREDYLNRVFEVQKNMLIARIREEEQQQFKNKLKHINLYYQKIIGELLMDMILQIGYVESTMKENHQADLVALREKYKETVTKIVKRLTEKFLLKLGEQENLLTTIYTKQIQALKINKECAVEFERTKGKEALKHFKHQMYCENISSLMYILCKERRKCQLEMQAAEKYYKNEIKKLKRTINNKSSRIKKLQKVRDEQITKIEIREQCLVELIHQFRKLIYLALQAAPTQAEFLLSIQRMMDFEVENYCVAQEEKNGKDLEEFRLNAADEAEKECAQVEKVLKGTKDDKNLELEQKQQQPVESDVLPAFYFNKNMYVREDFRNMISQGIEIRPPHPLWNRDVEELINILRQSIEKMPEIDKETAKVNQKEMLMKNENVMRELKAITSKKASSTPMDFSIESELKLFEQFLGKKHERPESRSETLITAGKANKSIQTIPQVASKSCMTLETHFVIATRTSDEVLLKEREINSTEMHTSESPKKINIVVESESKPKTRSTGSPSFQRDLKKGVLISQVSLDPRVAGKGSEEKKKSSRLLEFKKDYDAISKLTLARDSVILRISSFERKSLLAVSKTPSRQPSFEEVKDLPTSSAESKLVGVTDSLEVIKSHSRIFHEAKKSPSNKSDGEEKPAPFSKLVPLDEVAKRRQVGAKRMVKKATASKRVAVDTNLREPVTNEEFNERVMTLVNVMRRNPSLMALFTNGGG